MSNAHFSVHRIIGARIVSRPISGNSQFMDIYFINVNGEKVEITAFAPTRIALLKILKDLAEGAEREARRLQDVIDEDLAIIRRGEDQ
jgi:hypothetical protein